MDKKSATRIFCGFCGTEKTLDKHGYYSCHMCGSQTTPPEKTTAKMIRQEFEKNLPCRRDARKSQSREFMHIKSALGGGSQTKGPSKKQLMQKPSQKELYEKLCNKPAPRPPKTNEL